MMFSLRDFIKGGLLNAVGKMADYQVILNSASWFEKGVLLEEDLAEIQQAIDNQYIELETPVIDETPIEDETETDTPIIEETENKE
jgi:hypothetical protein